MRGKEIPLPSPEFKSKVSLEEAIRNRRSVRDFSNKLLSLNQISQLLWSAQGITDKRGFRSTPSAGATYPLEILICVSKDKIEKLVGGTYCYLPIRHSLILQEEGEFGTKLSEACFHQRFIAQVPLNIIIVAEFSRTTKHYGERGRQYIYIEVGHVGQNIYLQVISLNLATVAIGAFNDSKVSRVLNLPSNFVPLYVMPIGYKK